MSEIEKDIKIILIIVTILVIAFATSIIITRWIALETYEDVKNMLGPRPPTGPYAPNVTYENNETEHTLTVISIEGEPDELLWSNIELYNPKICIQWKQQYQQEQSMSEMLLQIVMD